MARPAPRPPFSALESERDDVLPLPPWQDGLAGYLAAQRWDDPRMRLLVCGGAGFIGSTFARQRLREHGDEVTVLDKLTYAGREENLADIREQPGFQFLRGAIEDPEAVSVAVAASGAQAIVNFAAETHVDRSIAQPDAFVQDPRARHLRAAGGRPRALPALRAGVHRRGVRLDRGGHLHRAEPAGAVLALLGHQGRRRPARAGLPPHLRAGRASSAAARTTTAPTSTPRS